MTTPDRSAELKDVRHYQEDIARIIHSVNPLEIQAVIDELFNTWQGRRRIFLAGNGGSAFSAAHFYADLCHIGENEKIYPPVMAVDLVSNVARITALTNDDGWEWTLVRQLERQAFTTGDVLCVFSVNGGSYEDGRSQNINRALDHAINQEGRTVGFVGNTGGYVRKVCHASILIPISSDPSDITPSVEGVNDVLFHLVSTRLSNRITQKSLKN